MKITATALGLLMATSIWAQAPANSQKPGAAGNGPQGGQTAEQSFNNRDANKDNFLVKTEITGSRLADSFDKFDTNKDGKLNLAEYKTGRDSMQGQGMGRQAQGTGAQSQGGNRQQMQGRNVDARFKERDMNGDGFVSKTEVSGSRMADRFDAMDTNKDAKLSLDEMKAGMQGMGGMGPNSGAGMPAHGKTSN